MSKILLRVVLFLIGLGEIYLGCDSAFGGVATLGFQTTPDYFSVLDQQSFLIRDSHVRFLGGIWIGIGFLYLLSAFNPLKWRMPIFATIGFIIIGALARLSGSDMSVVFGPDIIGPFIAELVFFPIIGFWLYRGTGGRNPRQQNG